MTEAVQIAIIASVGPTLIGVLNIVMQRSMGANIKRVETQTNSIKDALVAATALASHAEGVKDEKIRAAVEQNVPVNTVVAGPTPPPQL